MAKQFCVKTLILCLCVFFVCTAFAGQKDRQSDIYQLRSKPQTLLDDNVRALIKKHNFYCKKYSWSEKWHNKSGDFKNDFKDNGNGTITDVMTGLVWQKSGSDKWMTYDKVQAYIDGINHNKFAGYNDWRLPTGVFMTWGRLFL